MLSVIFSKVAHGSTAASSADISSELQLASMNGTANTANKSANLLLNLIIHCELMSQE
jgi:hypothetical protein